MLVSYHGTSAKCRIEAIAVYVLAYMYEYLHDLALFEGYAIPRGRPLAPPPLPSEARLVYSRVLAGEGFRWSRCKNIYTPHANICAFWYFTLLSFIPVLVNS